MKLNEEVTKMGGKTYITIMFKVNIMIFVANIYDW